MAIIITPVRTIVGSTGASGAQGFTAGCATHQTAVASAVTTALAVSDLVSGSISIGAMNVTNDPGAVIINFATSITYTRNVSS